MPKDFPTEAVISTATGFLICPIQQVYEVSEYMSGAPVWTHQLPRVSREIKAHLRAARPDLVATFDEAEGINCDNWQDFRDRFIARLGPTITLEPMPEAEHERIDPLSELAEKVHPDRIITIQV